MVKNYIRTRARTKTVTVDYSQASLLLSLKMVFILICEFCQKMHMHYVIFCPGYANASVIGMTFLPRFLSDLLGYGNAIEPVELKLYSLFGRVVVNY